MTLKAFNRLWQLQFLSYALRLLTELLMNFDAISKNVKILQIGPVEPKLWKIREINVVWLVDHAGVKNHLLPHGKRE